MGEQEHMANESLTRTLSGAVLVLIITACIIKGGAYITIMLLFSAFLMTIEWCKINNNKLTAIYKIGLAYIILPMLYWMVLLYFVPGYRSHMLLVFIIVWTTDTFAYIGGRIFKGSKLAPKISPTKTWSGTISGFTMAMIVSYIYIYSQQGSVSLRNMFWSIVISIAGILGDLLESKVKRILNVKDSGNIIPGHGGMCDRFDSFLMATYAYALLQHITSALE